MKINFLIYSSILFILITSSLARRKLKLINVIAQKDKFLIVDKHNNYRNQIASRIYTIEPNMLDFATNMVQMYWSEELTDRAQKIADKCALGHSGLDDRKFKLFPAGENIWVKSKDSEQKWGRVVDTWFEEIPQFRNKNIQSYVADFKAENFSQMIWANSYWIGCGYKECNEKSFYLCLYGPSGNIAGSSVFVGADKPGCACPKGTSCKNVYYKYLCCPDSHCKKGNLVYNGQPFPGTVPTI